MSRIESKVKIMPKAIVCEDCVIQGDVTISTGCVVHPSAQIIAETGPIVIGENCIIEEYAKIHNRIQSNSPDKPHVLTIGPNNIFEVGSVIEASKIGEKNIFECKSFVSSDVEISNGCVICAGCHLSGGQKLVENTVIFGKHCQQREALDRISGSHMLQLDFFEKNTSKLSSLKEAKAMNAV